ncbi:branched-chain amino acid transaminase [Candidatus Mycalebacterium sp.]
MPTSSKKSGSAKTGTPKLIWFNGSFVPWNDANIHILTHTLHYGMGVFEGIRAYRSVKDGHTAVLKLSAHIDRFFMSAHIAGMKIPHTKKTIRRAIFGLLEKNRLKEAYIRPISFIGSGAMGILPAKNPVGTAIAAWNWGAYLGSDGLNNGIRTKISSYTRMHVNSFMTKAKICGNYVNSVLAKQEAVSAGFDEAILLDAEGFVAEGSGENIFIVRNGVIKTPPLSSVLEGITRECVIRLATDEGIELREQRFTRDELYSADEIFLTGTAAEITPVREVDNRKIKTGKPGAITKKLQNAFFEITRAENGKYGEWLETNP